LSVTRVSFRFPHSSAWHRSRVGVRRLCRVLLASVWFMYQYNCWSYDNQYFN